MRGVLVLISFLALLCTVAEGEQYIAVKSLDNCTGKSFTSIGDYMPSLEKSFLVAHIEIENIGYDSFPVGPSYFAVIVDGNLYYSSYATYGLDKALNLTHLSDGELGNGKKTRGYVAFEVPIGSSKNYAIKYVGRKDWQVIPQKCS